MWALLCLFTKLYYGSSCTSIHVNCWAFQWTMCSFVNITWCCHFCTDKIDHDKTSILFFFVYVCFLLLLCLVPAAKLSVSPQAKEAFAMTKLHRDIAMRLIQCTEDEEFTDQATIKVHVDCSLSLSLSPNPQLLHLPLSCAPCRNSPSRPQSSSLTWRVLRQMERSYRWMCSMLASSHLLQRTSSIP